VGERERERERVALNGYAQNSVFKRGKLAPENKKHGQLYQGCIEHIIEHTHKLCICNQAKHTKHARGGGGGGPAKQTLQF